MFQEIPLRRPAIATDLILSRAQILLPSLVLYFCYIMQHFNWKSGGVGSPDLKPSTVYPCAGGLKARSLNFGYNLDTSRAESSDNFKSSHPILLY